MSESPRTPEAELLAQRLADIDAQRLHTWLLRSSSLRREDLLRSWSAAGPTPRELDYDVEAFLDWCAAGIELFLGRNLPSRRAIDDAAHRVMLAAVLRQHTSISAAAAALETSRRALRAAMKRLGIYEPWKVWRARNGRVQVPNEPFMDGKGVPPPSPEIAVDGPAIDSAV